MLLVHLLIVLLVHLQSVYINSTRNDEWTKASLPLNANIKVIASDSTGMKLTASGSGGLYRSTSG